MQILKKTWITKLIIWSKITHCIEISTSINLEQKSADYCICSQQVIVQTSKI
uniref:Uncharacterized protein n=1 Tax=Parascaris univalens TaxID=6257 RepID=A0A915C0E4_PARUN